MKATLPPYDTSGKIVYLDDEKGNQFLVYLAPDGVHVEPAGHEAKVLSYEELIDKAVEQLRLPLA